MTEAPTPGEAAITLSLIVPVKDEEEAIRPFFTRVLPILEGLRTQHGPGFGWEILFIDDGSSDATLAEIIAAHNRDPRIRGLSFSRNFGKEAALTAGLDHVRGQAVVPMDVDLQDPPEVLGAMIDKWREGYDVVYGVRANRMSDSLPKRLTADLYYRAHNWLSDDKIPEHAGDFRLLDRKVVDVIKQLPERNRFMKGLFAWGGFRQTAVEYDRTERKVGTTKFNYVRLWKLAVDGITSASTVPLRVWSYVGAMIAIVAIFYALYLVGRTILFGIDVAGYASMMVAVLFLGGVQLLSLGVLGEYVGRILVEAKHRPIYVVRQRIGDPAGDA
ncbi:glycosyltransferase involved in cell wall biosynthesis [Sphingomonas vulcanisoli]|uniref:Glycosyltransferase involved in cell wall biosynthesis n=1 Tax=Sphingomonas vulcanisoli TaxID=1658060 RepID=A0ABX0TXR2_9SPHN|nr:glycosyltransferase family 2 protein [Sphingomonas vulcanisoli]NIJ08974.1 glycosyltransferase involved in cell wall biosynthesis [Sphingomonas vulcanisoli]